MALGWMTVLKLVPWGEVIKSAPAVAEGARKLWDTVGRKRAPAVVDAAQEGAPALSGDDRLLQRLAAAEAEIATLHEQMQASSALIKALAEQNTELIRRAETQRVRMVWLAGLVLVFCAIAGLNLAVTLGR